MNIPPQPPSSEEPEQQPALHASEETPTLPSPTSDSLFEETEQQPTRPTLEDDMPTQPISTSEEPNVAGTTQHQPVRPSEEPQPVLSSEEPHATEEIEPQPVLSSEEPHATEEIEPQPVLSSEEPDVVEEDEDFEPTQAISSTSQPARSGVFIRKGLLIAAACIVVAAALLVALLVFVNRPKDPPTDWIASYTPPAGTSSTGKILYYLHWTNQNGELKGQLQLAAIANGAPQSLTAPAVGLYNRDNHIIYVVITINGQANTLTGKINDNNDTLNLNQPGATDQSSQFVFHIGNADDYKQAKQKLGSGIK